MPEDVLDFLWHGIQIAPGCRHRMSSTAWRTPTLLSPQGGLSFSLWRGGVVAYCRGPYCVLAYEAVQILRKKGIKARRMEDGYPEWRLRGLPVDMG